jgi:hypothetical protein
MSVSFSVAKRTGFSTTFGNGTWGININGTNYSSGVVNRSVAAGATVLIHSVSGVVIDHDANGAKSVSISISGSIPSTSWTSTTGSTTAVLDDYDRRPVFSDSTLASSAIRGNSYSDGVSASLTSSYSIVSGALPTGIGLNTSNGVVSGTPSVVGTFNFTIRANGSAEGSTDIARTITVNPATPVFSDSTVVATAVVGTAYSDSVAASEAASYSVRNSGNTGAGTLPGGLNLNTSTGAITGTPTTPGVFTFRIRATNVTGSTDTGILTITVTSGAKVWNGTAFVAGTTRVWNGTAFVSSTTRVWNGSAWTTAT